ncbi:MAG: class II aldolase/adducin family protein [Pseudomonadota bacterium]
MQGQYEKSMQELRQVSQMLGVDAMLIQGAGGNTSLKINDKMWVKASGKLLSRALEEEIFVPIGFSQLCNDIENTNFEITKYVVGVVPNLRPSIEAPLHAVFKSNAVIHAHAINSLTAMLLQDCKQHLQSKLSGAFQYIVIDYVAPGIELARTIKAGLKKHAIDVVDEPIVFMKNHGIVIGANSMRIAYDKLLEIEALLEFAPRGLGQNHAEAQTHTELSGYEFLANWQAIAFDEYCTNSLSQGIFFPDQAVYLGEKIRVLNSFDNAGQEPLVIIKNVGVFRRKNCDQSTIEIIEALLSSCIRLPFGAKINIIEPHEVDFLLNWEAEKYRKSQTNIG